MMHKLVLLVASSAMVLVAASALPATLLSFDDLQKRLATHDTTLRILDVRTRADFDKGHIPGAIWVDAKAAAALAAKPDGLTDSTAWTTWITPLAIGRDTEVVVYGGDRQLSAARIWWLLKYLGVEKVGLIDGNFALWSSEGRPVSTVITEVEPQAFRVTYRSDRHATRGDVLAALEAHTALVIDARSEPEHTGAEAKAKRGGHIPTACPLEWIELVGLDGRFLNDADLRIKLAKSGIKPGQALITHCQSGGRASVNTFVFERLGYPARNYYLGWSDWGNADATPVVKGKEAVDQTKP